MQLHLYIILLGSLIFLSCQKQEDKVEKVVADFYDVYQNRIHIDSLLSFYADSATVEDVISGFRCRGKDEIKAFFDWSNPDFRLLQEKALIVNDYIFNENTATITGHFEPFQWGEERYEEMLFTTLLHLNSDGLIVRQTDWINYPNELLDYEKRGDANQWIRENKPFHE